MYIYCWNEDIYIYKSWRCFPDFFHYIYIYVNLNLYIHPRKGRDELTHVTADTDTACKTSKLRMQIVGQVSPEASDPKQTTSEVKNVGEHRLQMVFQNTYIYIYTYILLYMYLNQWVWRISQETFYIYLNLECRLFAQDSAAAVESQRTPSESEAGTFWEIESQPQDAVHM